MDGYTLEFDTKLSYRQLIDMVRVGGQRLEFDPTFVDRTIKPDGGVIWLLKGDDEDYRRLVLVSEIKKQGTNKERIKEGRAKQAQGNAIERLGKNLIGIRAAMNHEALTPFCMFRMGLRFRGGLRRKLIRHV